MLLGLISTKHQLHMNKEKAFNVQARPIWKMPDVEERSWKPHED